MNGAPEVINQTVGTSPNPFELRNRGAVRLFLKTVIIADNEPTLSGAGQQSSQYLSPTVPAVPGRSSAPGSKKNSTVSDDRVKLDTSTVQDNSEGNSHQLDLSATTNAFAAQGIICGTYLPNKQTPDNEITDRLVSLAAPSDAAIFDWQLSETGVEKCQPTINAIVKIFQKNASSEKQLRLIVIYTGEINLKTEAHKLGTALKNNGFSGEFKEENFRQVLEENHIRIIFCNKKNSQTTQLNPVAPAELPDFILDQFSKLSRGLLRSYALACVAAIRSDTPRLMTQYGSDLDGVFVAQRVLNTDPDDASAMMRDIMLSDLATTLRSPKVEDFLGEKANIDWFEQSKLFDENGFYDKKLDLSVDEIKLAIQHKLEETKALEKLRKYKNGKNDLNKFFIKNETELLQDLQKESIKMAHIITYSECNHPDIGRNTVEPPILTLGSVIKNTKTGEFAMCIVPRCDSVRLAEKDMHMKYHDNKYVNFPIIDLKIQDQGGKYFFFTPTDDESIKPLGLQTKKLSHQIRSIKLYIHDRGAVIAQKSSSDTWIFKGIGGKNWEWVGTLREMVAQNIIATTCNALNRVGLNEYEWLRFRKPS